MVSVGKGVAALQFDAAPINEKPFMVFGGASLCFV
jgi:hypothetical protein